MSETESASNRLAPIRLGLCGLGYGIKQGRLLLQRPFADSIRIVAVCDQIPERLSRGVAEFKCKGYASLESLLEDKEIEAVGLFSSPAGRAELIMKIIRAGKHVMTTKPFELDPVAALEVLYEARRRKRLIHLNSPSSVLGRDLAIVQEWQARYSLGEIIFAQSDCWYRALETPDGSWYDDPELCPVAPICRLGIYGINDILALMKEPVELQVLESRIRTLRPTPDVAQVSVRFANGSMAVVRATWCCGPIRNNQVSEYVFERGVIRRSYEIGGVWESDTILTLDAIDRDDRAVRDEAKVSQYLTNSAYRWDLFHLGIRQGGVVAEVPPEVVVAGVRFMVDVASASRGGGTWRRVC
jgi:predicted dehydrogenase